MIGQVLYHEFEAAGYSPSLPLPSGLNFNQAIWLTDLGNQVMTETMKPFYYIKTTVTGFAILAGVTFAGLCAANHAYAAEPVVAVAAVKAPQSGTFSKTSFSIKGEWQIVKENGQTIFRLSDNFKTKNGPDLKLFISPKTVSNVTGETATDGAVRLSVLRSTKGAQDYIIPETIDLSQFGSILIHCEAFSKLWGGANL